jgi:hypothetical protein
VAEKRGPRIKRKKSRVSKGKALTQFRLASEMIRGQKAEENSTI